MQSHLKVGLVFGLITLMTSTGVTAKDEADAPEPNASSLSQACTGCHGTDGASAGPAIPTIAGLSVEYFIEIMQRFKSGKAPSTVMGRIAKGYSEEEMELMAEYFGSMPFVRAKQETDPALTKKGAKLHRKYCEKCHARGGQSRDEDAGVLAGQWRAYLAWTLEDFQTGKREMPKKMKQRMEKLMVREGNAGLNALLHYYASQQ